MDEKENQFYSTFTILTDLLDNMEGPIYDFLEEMKNDNTKRKTESDLNLLKTWLLDNGEQREPRAIRPSELDLYLARFYLEAKKKNGEPYEPSSLSSLQTSLIRYFKENDYEEDIKTSARFSHSRAVLSAKQKQLKAMGLGNKRNKAHPFDDDDITKLWESGELGTGKSIPS